MVMLMVAKRFLFRAKTKFSTFNPFKLTQNVYEKISTLY